MAKLKCPRCKEPIKKDDTFCKNCGSPVREEAKKGKEEIKEVAKEEIKEEKTDKFKENEQKEPKNNLFIPAIIGIVLILLGIAIGFFLFNKEEKECKKCPVCEECEKCSEPVVEYIEKEPTIQYINFKGHRFSMPLDWNFEGTTDNYKFMNEKENLYVSISKLDTVNYETFISKDYQNIYLEKLQTEYNIEITKNYEKTQDEINYYLLEGTFESYNYIIIVTKVDNGIFMVEAQFENNSVYTNKKQEVIDFALSSNKNNKM